MTTVNQLLYTVDSCFLTFAMKVFSMWKFWKVQKTTNLWWVATKKTKIGSPTKTRWWFHPYFLFSSRKLGKMMNPIWRSRRFWQDGVCHWFNHQQTKRSAIFSLTRSIHWNNIEMMWWPLQLGEWWSDWSNLSVGRWWREPGIHFLFDFGWSYANLFGSVGFAMLLLIIMRETWKTDDESDGTHFLLHHCGYDDDNPHPDDISTDHRNTYDIRLNIIIGLYCQRPKAVHTSTQHLPTYTWQSITKKNRNMSCNISLPLFTSTDKLSSPLVL